IRRSLEKGSQLFFKKLTTGDTEDELAFRKMRNRCKSKIRQWNIRKQATILDLARKNRNVLFKYIGYRRRNKSSAFSLRDRNGEPTSDPVVVSEFYRDHYADIILIERIQQAATKMVTGLKSMDYEMSLAVLDLFPLEYRRLQGDLILTYALFEQGLANRFFTVDPANTRRGHGQTTHRNTRMKKQFNRHPGATSCSFSEGQRVLVRDYSGRHPTWTPGLILCGRSKVLYEIQVCPAWWIRHTNQIRLTDEQILLTGPSELSPEILLDTFDLGTLPGNPSAASSEAQPEHGLQPRRWTGRIRKIVRPLQVDPWLGSYVNKVQGGMLGRIPHGSRFTTRTRVLLRPRSLSHARLVKYSGRLPVRHQAEL
ncbi:pol-related protein, partial [Clonorchis sinensis]